MKKPEYYLINAITLYRLFAAPFLVFLIFKNEIDIFKWLLAFSFFTDLIDGYFARRFKATSLLGSKLDSIADDFTIAAALIALFVFKMEFIQKQIELMSVLLILFIIQTIYALKKYGKISSFHTYFAKLAAILQGSFLILIFLLPKPIYTLFYLATIFTTIDLIEEIILVNILPKWETNVKGLFWVMKRRK